MFLRLLLLTFTFFLSQTLFAFDETRVAASLGLELVLEGHPYNFFGINALYVNDDMSRQMLVVSSVQGELKETRFFHHKGFLIVEIPKSSTHYASVAFVGIKEDEVKEKIKTTSVWRKFFDELNPLPKAYASDCSLTPNLNLDGIKTLADHYGKSLWKSALKCMDQANNSFYDGTIGRAKDLKEGLANLFQDPKKFWEEKVAAVRNVGEFISQFDVKIKQMSAALMKLPAEIIASFLCGFIGGMGADALISLMVGGIGAGKLLFRLEEFVTRLIRLEKVFSVLEKAGKLKSIPMEFIEKLSLGRIPESLMKSLDTFGKHDFPEFIEGAMQCSL